MDTYDELMLAIALITLVMGLLWLKIYFKYKIKKLEDIVDELTTYINTDLDPQIKNIRQLVIDEIINKKEE